MNNNLRNKRRLASLKLMREMQPFLQGQVVDTASCKEMITKYVEGDETLLREFIMNPNLPLMYEQCINNIKVIMEKEG